MAEVVLPQVQQANTFGSIHIANFVPKQSTGKPSLAKRGCRKGTKMNTYITGLEKKGVTGISPGVEADLPWR